MTGIGEAAVERLESAVWPLAGGVACAFVLAAVLKDAAWQVAFGAVAVSVAGWALPASPEAGAAIGTAGWAFVTGFDVAKTGELALSGAADAGRAGALVAIGAAAGTAGTTGRRSAARRA
ncbi:hypothetical protein, partial [Actinomadura yumaensis]